MTEKAKEIGKGEKGERIWALPAGEILIPEGRQRQLFRQRAMDKLVASMKIVGQLQPGVCRTNEHGSLELLVGERRLRACFLLERSFEFYLKEDISSPYLLEKIQLDENLVREDLEWQEDVNAKERLHQLFQGEYGETEPGKRGGHSLSDTAEYIGEGKSLFAEDVKLAAFAREIPEVAAAPNKTTAKKIVARLVETFQREEALKAALVVAEERSGLVPRVVEGKDGEEEVVLESSAVSPDHSLVEKTLLEYDRRCILGKMETVLEGFPDEHFHLVLFDPPWGVDYAKVKKEVYGQKNYDDSPEAFFVDLELWLRLLYKKMTANSHLFLFFGVVHYSLVYHTLAKAGFETEGIPIIWAKKGARRTRSPAKWFGRSYEPIAFARKGNKALAKQGHPNLIETPQPTPAIKDIHPSAKHPEIYYRLIRASLEPGERLLDPMAGSGMVGVAAEHLRAELSPDWYLVEQDKDFRNLQIYNLNKGYGEIVRGSGKAKASPAAEVPHPSESVRQLPAFGEEGEEKPNFRPFPPGSEAWTTHWKRYPEDQDAMLEWRKGQS